ncbi:MAG: sulfite exporter TauE/SafE family protein [Pseudomonadota bacterium]
MIDIIHVITDCILISAGAGLIYGVFGGGSGMLMTPGFYYILRHFSALSTYQMQIAIATTCAASAILGISAVKMQWQRNNIDWQVIRSIFPGIFVGTLLAVLLLNLIPSAFLKKLFSIVVISVAFWFWFYNSEKDCRFWQLSSLKNHLFTTLIGLLWFLLGVAVFTVPYLHKCKINIHRAIGCATLTSTVFSAVAGILLAISGMRVIGVHHGNIGFVNVLLLAFSIIPSSLCGYLSARISTKLPQKGLKKIYAVLIFTIGVLMII